MIGDEPAAMDGAVPGYLEVPVTTDKVTTEEACEAATKRYRPLMGIWRWIGIVIPAIVILLAVNQLFDLRFFVGYLLYDYSFYYLLLALFLSLAFLHLPVTAAIKGAWARRLFWVDVAFFFSILGMGLYLAWHGLDIIIGGWAWKAPLPAVIMAVILWFLVVESARRAAGWVLGMVVLIASMYPLFAQYMPGVLQGVSRPFLLTAQFHMLGIDSAMGLVAKLFGDLLLGYILFGVAVVATGGGQFFLNLALSLVGHTRGGPAKVAVIASFLFGTLSGSAPVNVLTTGCVTIPAMKRIGYAPHYAGAVECCASTGGTLTPPVMGANAFLMASYLNIPYAYVAMAAAIPSILYYWGLFIQVDGYAAKARLGSLAEEVPPFIETLKDGWFYLPVVALLVYYLFVLRSASEAPYIATAAMLVLAQIRKQTRLTWQSFLGFLEKTGQTAIELFTVLVAVGMLMGAFAITGIAVTFSRELLFLAGGNMPLMLILCAVASLILGMGMPAIACYIFLAIVIAPALIMKELDPVAVHLYVLYWGMISYITPPVAVCAFPAAALAETSPMKVAVASCRLAGVIFLIPFFFVLDTSLILHGEVGEVLRGLSSTALGVFLIASALQGYMVGIGRLWPARGGGYSLNSYFLGTAIVISGFLLGLPWWQTKVSGLVIAAVILLPTFLLARRQHARGTGSPG